METVYEKAMLIALHQKGLKAVPQVPLTVKFRKEVVGQYFADIMVEDTVVVELKAISHILPEHKAQLINYLKATGYEVGLLLNFGRPKLDFHRLYFNHNHPVHPVEFS